MSILRNYYLELHFNNKDFQKLVLDVSSRKSVTFFVI